MYALSIQEESYLYQISKQLGVDYDTCKALNPNLGLKYKQFQAPIQANEPVFLPTFMHTIQKGETAYSIYKKYYPQSFQKEEMDYLLGVQGLTAESIPENFPLMLIQHNSLKEVKTIQREGTEENINVEDYFNKYEQFAKEELDYLYANVHKGIPEEGRLTPKLFVDVAKMIYERKKDLKYIAPVQLAIAQLINEGFVEQGRVAGNAFNIGAHDTGVTEYEKSLNTLEKGFSAYYNLIADSYLKTKTADELLKAGNFTNAQGGAYALNPHYEVLASGHIGEMYRRRSDIKLTAGVGKGRENNPHDVRLVGSMLAEIGYLDKHKISNVKDVTKALQMFQKQEIVTPHKDWYKKRMDELYKAEFKLYGKDPSQVMGSGYEAALIQQARMSDGVVDPGGNIINILYFRAYLNNRIPKL